MEILIFTRNGDRMPRLPSRPGLDIRHIQFESNSMENLLLVAKYRIINFPTSLIIDNRGKILLKVKGSIPDSYVDNIIN